MRFILLLMTTALVQSFSTDQMKLATDYFSYKNIKYVSYFSCEHKLNNNKVVKELNKMNTRTAVIMINKSSHYNTQKVLYQWNVVGGIILDGACDDSHMVLLQASKHKLFDAMHNWLIFTPFGNNVTEYIDITFKQLNLSIDANVAVVGNIGEEYIILDVYNFGKIQGNYLEIASLGSWQKGNGLKISLHGYKYYHRWNFHNLTLRAISVILDQPKVFQPEMLSSNGYTSGVAPMTKITSQLLNILRDIHNFRFNYTIAGKWIGSPKLNATLAVTNSLFWEEQDISSTCARIFPMWLNWVDICFPPTTTFQTKFYYLMSDKGVGNYENRFLTPLSLGVWWCILGACGLCIIILALTAWVESRPKPGLYAFFSVSAALFQQDFEDGIQEDEFSSQGRKLTLLVVGLTSMLLYNYYTSSVVSWLLNAPAPSIDSLDELMKSDLELVFEDIGYTRGWLENPGFYYYSGFVNPKEDNLRETKVTKAKRTVKPLQSVSTGIELIKTGPYAYHTDPYTASQEISKTYQQVELCELGSLQMMLPSPVYVMVQKRSPYKEFFVWSLMRLSERGHFAASRGRFAGTIPSCSGGTPRALALGQAAPAFLILLQLTLLSVIILVLERLWHKIHT